MEAGHVEIGFYCPDVHRLPAWLAEFPQADEVPVDDPSSFLAQNGPPGDRVNSMRRVWRFGLILGAGESYM